MQDHLPVQIRSIVKEELQTALNDHKVNVMAAMRSQASTPVPDAQQLQAVIMGLLRQGQVNSAFQQVRCHGSIWDQCYEVWCILMMTSYSCENKE